MDRLYTFWDNITQYKTESVHFLGLMNSATKILIALELYSLKPPQLPRPLVFVPQMLFSGTC